MIKHFASMLLGLSAFLLANPMAAQPFDGSKALLCAAMEAIHCTAGEDCSGGSAEAINFPEFFRVDFEGKVIKSTRSDGSSRTTPIETIAHSDAGVLMHGSQAEFAWSMVISDEGKTTLTVSGNRQGFIVFGACTVP